MSSFHFDLHMAGKISESPASAGLWAIYKPIAEIVNSNPLATSLFAYLFLLKIKTATANTTTTYANTIAM